MPRPLSYTIDYLERELVKLKAVQEKFPDAKVTRYATFSSKNVNQNYTKFEFERRRYGTWVLPYCEVKYEYNGLPYTVRVHSAPKASRLAYLGWDPKEKKRVIKFSRLAINLKNNLFREDMLNDCRVEITTFIKDNPGHPLDNKHLEPRLKKLIVFI